MKNVIITLLLLILIDGMLRSVGIAYTMGHEKINENFFKAFCLHTLLFVIAKSWFYIIVSLIYALIVSFFAPKKSTYMYWGILTATLFYLAYVYFLSTAEFDHYRFIVRIIQYPFFGSLFGLQYYRYQIKLKGYTQIVS